jgi:hypothetical protein
LSRSGKVGVNTGIIIRPPKSWKVRQAKRRAKIQKARDLELLRLKARRDAEWERYLTSKSELRKETDF